METCDLLVVGAGPAGLEAALNAASEGLSTTVLERERLVGGQIVSSARIDNYLGFPGGVSGATLSDNAIQQATMFGANFILGETVIDLRRTNGEICVLCESGVSINCRSTIVACGVNYRVLSSPGVSRLLGRGVYYGMNPSDAHKYKGKKVFIIGGANSAGQAAVHFASNGADVTLLARTTLAGSMSAYLLEGLATVRILTNARLAAARGEDVLTEIVIATDQEVTTETADGVFIFIGADPMTDWLQVKKDRRGFVLTEEEVTYATNEPGVFAIGDGRAGSIKRIAAAAGEGSSVVPRVHDYLSSLVVSS